ncbi:hypothetical protein CLV47_103262 [Antricoccus suffuscus]|uniref:Copper(I)-binding protein n=1 Tax=Antricoccus suffuscus TaxID=1629062 RepID=A0A2T1A3T4_9ACTN|nr:hypothetical protein [Antricoccus suffuscus]PRZ43204.1 hypothetical protein CLV47_103262 [Antricoccus suffuscus]
MSQTASVKTSTPARRPRRKAFAAVALPIAATMMLAGCSAGQITQTADQRSEVPGTTADLGNLHVRAAEVSPPTSGHYFSKGSTMYLEMQIANDGAEDQLTAATIDGVDAKLEGPSASSAPRNAESTGAGLASTITIAEQGITSIGEDNTITADAAGKFYPAQYIKVVLTFKDAGDLKMSMPIGVPITEAPKVNSDKIDLHPKENQGEVD